MPKVKKKAGKKIVHQAASESIQVACRVRPLNASEVRRGDAVSVTMNKTENTVQCGFESTSQHTFPFDQVFGKEVTNEVVYEDLCAPIVDSVLDGINGSIMAYGQTGGGKTYTMFGEGKNEGMAPRIMSHIYEKISECPKSEFAFDVRMSALEIYQNKIYDLIGTRQHQCEIKLQKKTMLRGVDRLIVQGATEVATSSKASAMSVLLAAQIKRTEAATKMNKRSSRSHCIVVVSVAKQDLNQRETKFAQLYICDLAGSENASKTGASGQRLDEAKEINKSLTTLGRVIDCLILKAAHIPYRDSNLTRLLQNSLGGNARCALCIHVSPSQWNYAESLSTMFFGCRTREIKNKPIANQYLSVIQLQAVLNNYGATVRKNEETLMSLENEISDMEEFFDIVRHSKLGPELLLCSKWTSILDLKRLSPELLAGSDKGGSLMRESGENIAARVR